MYRLLASILTQTTDPATPAPLANEIQKTDDAIKALEKLSFDDAITKIANSLVDFAFKLVIAILVFYVGRFIIRKLFKVVHSLMTNRKMDASLTTFVLSLVNIILYFILIITIVGILGIETSSFLALFASAGVAIGMALSGTLQNFAGGVLILLLKPYKVGDYIETQGYTGTVKSIQIFNTIINTIDNKAIIIPNGMLSTSTINNYSLEQYRRVDWTVALSYGTDYQAAHDAIMAILKSDDRVVEKYIEDDRAQRWQDHIEQVTEAHEKEEARLDEEASGSWWKRFKLRRRRRRETKLAEQKAMEIEIAAPAEKVDRSPFVALSEMADSSINFTVRAWTHSSNYWGLYFDMNRRFYTELQQQGFSFPFPQLDVHVANS